MALDWDDSFVLGIDEIDQQHRSIIEHFNRFSLAVQDGSSNQILAEMAMFLKNYAHMHFTTEETYMKRYNYPHINEQLKEHDEFTLDAEELLLKIELDGASRELALGLTGKMVRWVIQHIRNHDRQMVRYVLDCMESQTDKT